MIYQNITENVVSGKKQLAVLIDPDKQNTSIVAETVKRAFNEGADYIFIGGSLLSTANFEKCTEIIKNSSPLPLVIFPGNAMQISGKADAILFLSLISGRNPELLIGQHVISAPFIKETGLEVIPTGYIIIDSGKPTSVQYMSNSSPIPHDKDDIAYCTALAGEMLGLKMIYLDAGSGALKPVRASMVKRVKEGINVPLITGGGIKNVETALSLCEAGADILVVGNAVETDTSFIAELVKTIK